MTAIRDTPLTKQIILKLYKCAGHADHLKPKTTLNNGYLGSYNDEERSEMRYVM